MAFDTIVRGLRIALALALLPAFAACGPSGPLGKVSDVEGTIRLDGTPLAMVSVQFLPEESKFVGASGMTDENGHYSLSTSDGRMGAVIAKYRVILRSERADARSKSKGSPRPVPLKYTQATSDNDLSVEVIEAKKTGYDFDLKSR